MTADEMKALIHRWVDEVWNGGNLALADELMTPDYVLHLGAVTLNGPAGFKGLCQTHLEAFPDFHITVEDIIIEGDKCVWRFSVRGTQTGTYMGIPPSGNAISIGGAVISRFVGDRWVEDWPNWDALGILQQLGVVPTVELAGVAA
jgi:predicted ester cyclase